MDIYDTIRVKTKRPIGFLWHFGHFMHDFLMPMNDYLTTVRPSPSHKLKIILFSAAANPEALINNKAGQLKKDDFLGDFREIAEKFLNIEVQYEFGMHFAKLINKRLHLVRPYSFGPYFPQTFDSLISRAQDVYDLESCNKYPPVILIERGCKPLSADRMGGQWVKTGSAIRTIENHGELKEALSNKYGDSFINVRLEDMPFEEQIALFKNAKLVVAQHGAGMCNIAWMVNKGATVLELPPVRFQTFANMCSAKQLDYRVIFRRWVKDAPAPARVDVTQIMSMLSDIDVGAVRT